MIACYAPKMEGLDSGDANLEERCCTRHDLHLSSGGRERGKKLGRFVTWVGVY